jgi:hypothetical protein
LVVVALCASLGFHWAFLQSVAWVGMMVNFSRQVSLAEAVVKTFDGQHPCPICKLVSEGKKSEKKSDVHLDTQKQDLFADGTAVFLFPLRPVDTFSVTSLISSRSDAPPLPPPRPFLG